MVGRETTRVVSLGNASMHLCCAGELHCQSQSGRLSVVKLESHRLDISLQSATPPQIDAVLQKSIALGRWHGAWRVGEFLKDAAVWRRIAYATMEVMDVELAIRANR